MTDEATGRLADTPSVPTRLDPDPDPLISIVVAVRNGVVTIERCLDSVLSQTFAAWELIVIDGDSTDGTTATLKRYDDRIAHWVSEPDSGIYNAWNKALAHVRGTWIQFLGADDRLASTTALDEIAPSLRAAEGQHRIVYGIVRLVEQGGQVAATWGAPWPSLRGLFRGGMVVPHPGTFHHRSLFDGNNGFDERFRIAGDYEFLLRELLSADAEFVAIPIAEMGSQGVSNRPENLIASAIESERARRLHGLGRGPAELAPHVLLLRARVLTEHLLGPKAAAIAARLFRAVVRKPAP